jgi:inosine/xanthosine triphosphatase
MRFSKQMALWQKKLETSGFKVYVPGGVEDIEGYKEAGSGEEAYKRKTENDYIRHHFKSIQLCEGILVINHEKNEIPNYIGGNSLMEIGFAFTMNRDIFMVNPIPQLSYEPEIRAMHPIIVGEKVTNIANYYNKLPKVYVSSENILKMRATSLAFREFNKRCEVKGIKTQTGVKEQPDSIEEAYQGAENRLNDMKTKLQNIKYEYLVSIESGIVKLHSKHTYIGFSVCIIENKKGKKSAVINTDLEIPKSLTDQVPSKYPDLGILVQDKYGIEEKDPYLYFTKGRVSRERFLKNSVTNALTTVL